MSGDAGKIEHYLKRSRELRAVAEKLRTAEARTLLLNIADHYERLAAALMKQARGD